MAVTQYIGARYVPMFYTASDDSNSWEAGVQYDPLTVVTYLNQSYTSKIPVPTSVGNPADNPTYWILTGGYNAQVEQYRQEVEALAANVDFIYTVSEPMTFADMNADLAALTGDVVLVLRADVQMSGAATLSSNVKRIIGLGGKFDSTAATHFNMTVPADVVIEADGQIFHEQLVPVSSGLIRGWARPQMWGATGSVGQNAQDMCDSMTRSAFVDIEFPKGIYVAYVSNDHSGRRFRFYPGAIIDGVIHLATGADSSHMVNDTKVIGTIVSTLRVGTYHCNFVSIPDGIRILDVNAIYPNQTSEGGPKGVHIYHNSHYVNIGDIVIENASSSYGFGIDKDPVESVSTCISVKTISINKCAATIPAVIVSGCGQVTIDSINDQEASNNHSTLVVSNASYVNVHRVSCSGNYPSNGKIAMANNSRWIHIETANLYSTAVVTNGWGVNLNNVNDVSFGELALNGFDRGLRSVDSYRLSIRDLLITNCTTPTSISGGSYNFIKEW